MQHFTILNKQISKYAACIMACFITVFGTVESLKAQGVANINVTGIPGVINTPFTDQFEQNFRNGRYQVIFTYNNTNTQPVDFRFEFILTQNGKEVIDVTSDPKSFSPGAYVFTSVFDELPFRQTFDDILDQIDQRSREQIVQSGTIPEGNYILNIRAIPEANSGMISSMPSVNPFTVLYPQPPILINPPNKANLTLETPVFNWTPVPLSGFPIDYEFLLVEVLDQQTPLQAINSNRAHAEATLTGQNTLVYTPEYLPLEEGQEYAWRVRATSVDGNLPIKDEGESPIYTFVYKDGVSSETIAEVRKLKELQLIPGFAKLIDLDRVEVDEGPNFYSLNGTASLELDFSNGGKQQIDVTLNDIRIQKGSLDAPVLMGGSLRGNGTGLSSVLHTDSKILTMGDVTWKLGEGVSMNVELQSPDGRNLPTQGELMLDKQGARGTIKAIGDPLFTYGDGLVEVEVKSFEASFPEGTIYGEGSVNVLGEESGCELTRFAFVEGQFITAFRCSEPMAIPLVENSNRMNMVVQRMDGDLKIDTDSGELDYDLDLSTSIGLETEDGQACGAEANLNLTTETGLEINNISQNQNCKFIQPKIDLGFFTIELHQSTLQHLAYEPNSGEWEFEIMLGTKFEIPSFGEWGSHEIRDLRITHEGAHFEEIDFSEELESLPDFDINRYQIKLETLEIAEFLFPIFDWDQTGPGPWDLAFSGKVAVPNRSDYPQCIRGQKLALNGGKVSGNEVSANIQMPGFNGCTFEFGAGYAFNIDDMAGKFGVEFLANGQEKPIGRLDFSGSLALGQPFTCGADPSVELANSTLSFTTGIEGMIDNIIPSCEIPIGPFTADISTSSLEFSHSVRDGQQASLRASASLDLSEGQTANGSFDLNLITGRFNSLNFVIDEPFDWNIPAEDPVLSFRLNKATLTEEGFSVDGRQQFLLPSNQVMGATFDSLLIDVETLQIKRGRILFDSEFAFTAGIDQSDGSLSFQAVESDTELLQDPGLYMGMTGQIQIDSQGIHTDGQADASIKFNGDTYDLAQVEYSDGFRFQLFPFNVGNGRADIMYNGSRLGWVDPDGFHPAPGFFADLLIPDHLPLPTMDIAYLTLREDGELLVEAVENADGNYALSTLPGKSLTLTAPVFNPNGSPSVSNVILNNVVISGDPTSPEIIEGSVEVTIPENDPMWQLKDRNVPLTLNKIEFSSRPVNGTQITALHLLGDLHLFENDLPDSQQQFGFYIQSNGIIQANLDITGMDARVPLLPEDKATLKVEGISGTYSLPEGESTPIYNLMIDSGFELDTETGISTGAEFNLRLTPGKMELKDFVAEDLNGTPEFDFGVFGLKLKSLKSIPYFDYTPGSGFDFAFAFDADIRIQPEGSEEIIFPLRGFEIRNDGIQIPIQDISSASIPGLDLPEFDIAGFAFKPISFETTSPFTFNWGQGIEFNPNVNMSFEVELPEFEGTGLNPPDGLTFNNVGLTDGFLSGSIEPFQPLGGAEISLVPGLPDSPTLNISELFGSLSVDQNENGDLFQTVNIDLTGELGNLPAFNIDDPDACVENGSFTLSLVQSKYFEGTVSGVKPCGYLELGPAQIAVTNADLNFSVSSDQQMAELDGGVVVTLPATTQGAEVTANGNLVLDLIEGEIKDGSVAINQQFGLDLPHGTNDPLFTFGINQAVLSKDGLLVNGTGNLAADGVQSTVQFNDLLLGFNPFGVQSGNASIATNFAMEVGVQPLSLKLKDPNSAMPADNAIELSLTGDLELNSTGLALSGSSMATVRFQGEEYAAVEVEYRDGFTLNVGGFAVNQGQALFYEVENGVRSQDPLAILNENGFNLGSAIMALLPARIPLPSEDIAYIDIKDSDDNLLVDVTPNEESGGYTISTDGTPIPLVIAALEDQSGDPIQADVQFSLTTDGSYNVTSGSLTLESDISMEPSLDLPLSLTEFTIGDNGSGIELQAGLKVDLPGPLSEHSAVANAVINSNGLSQGTISLGNHRTAYQTGITPLYTYEHSGSVNGSAETDIFEAELWGIEAEFGSTNSIALSGILNSSLILEVSGGSDPIFYSASWSDTGWDFDIDPGSLGDLAFGNASLDLNDQYGIDIESDNNSFYLIMNGVISMDDVIGEPLDITIQDLEVGVSDYDTQPRLHFALGSSSGSLDSQTFSLFEGALEGEINNPTITLNGRSVALSSRSGTLTFLEKNIDYTDLIIDTEGGLSFDKIEANGIDLIPDYVSMNTLALSVTDGLRLESELSVTLPAPVNQSTTSTVSIYRDEQNVVKIEATDPSFDLEQEYALGDFGHFELTKVQADINPNNWRSSGIYASGELYKSGETTSIISFGSPTNLVQNPGIGISAKSPYLQFNATGNIQFSYDFSVFEVTVGFDEISASTDGFEITLNGTLGVKGISGISTSSEIGYENFVINQDGVKDTGNLDGSGELTLDGIGKITIGQFIYEKYDNGTDIEIVDASAKSPNELDGNQSEVPIRVEQGVSELLCFGPCPISGAENSGTALDITINAGSNSDTGGISGGVETIFFMKKASGDFELLIDGLNASLMDNFSIAASMHYKNSEDGFLLRAAATGKFSFGNDEVSAAIAGKFANVGGETSYGLFVAAQTSVGIPIIPGIVDLTGAGGGFFWKPEQEDLETVRTAVQNMGHTIVSAGKFKEQNSLTFAAQLYAAVGIAGSGGQYVVEGSTFLEITNKSFYMDVNGVVLGMDGSANAPAKTKVSGMMSLMVQTDPTFISGTINVEADIPAVLTGSGGIEYFSAKNNGQTVWGIIGNADYSIYAGILNGGGEFLAANEGVLLEVSLGFDVDVPIIEIKSSVTGSIWMIDDPDFSMPFGAYVVFSAKACLGFCISADAKAAFVKYRSSGFQLYGAVKGCVDLLVTEGCLSAWVSITENSFNGGFGKGSHNDLVAQARDQRDRFRAKIQAMMDGIQAAKDKLKEPPILDGPAYSDEDVIRAGANIYTHDFQDRRDIATIIENVVEENKYYAGGSLPTSLQNIVTNLLVKPKAYKILDLFSSRQRARQDLSESVSNAQAISDAVVNKLSSSVEKAIDFNNDAETAFDNMLASMSESPVSNVVKPAASTNATESTSFTVDETKAEEQANNAESLIEEIDKLDQQFRESIAQVEENLSDMQDMLAAEVKFEGKLMNQQASQLSVLNPQISGLNATGGNTNNVITISVTPSINALATAYMEVYQNFEKYFALEANWRWMEWEWAYNLRSEFIDNQSSIENGVSSLNNRFSSRLGSKANSPSAYKNEVYKLAQRNQAIIRFSNANFSANFPHPSSPNAADGVNVFYDRLINPNMTQAGLNAITTTVNQTNTDFWYNMHVSGLAEMGDKTAQTVLDDVIPEMNALQSDLRNSHKGMTTLLDDFYSNKASLSSILYNMIDNYIYWKDQIEIGTDDATTATSSDGIDYLSRLQELSNDLRPPQITDINADPNRASVNTGQVDFNTFYNDTEISWTATHATGVIENSININQDELTNAQDAYNTSVSVGSDDYLSLGENTSINIYPFKTAFSQTNIVDETKIINVGLRTRGNAGNTATRRAVFYVDVGPDGFAFNKDGGLWGNSSDDTSVFEVDRDQPRRPILKLGDFYQLETKREIPENGGYGVNSDTYWTNNGENITLRIQAYDAESDISTYEYAIGTTRGATDIVDWSELQGIREFLPEVPTSQITGETRMINMQEGISYYVSVRATNGDGMTSRIKTSNRPLKLDTTKPEKPGIAYIVAPMVSYFTAFGYSTPVDPVSESVPRLSVSLADRNAWSNAVTPEVTASWSRSTDNESGIEAYEYIVSESEDAVDGEFEADDVKRTNNLSMTYSGETSGSLLENYSSEVYVHVRSVDRAGNGSDIRTIGPLKPKDPSAPYSGVMQAKVNPNDVKLYFTDLPYDAETDLKGIQYSIGSSPGASDLRAWPGEGEVDFVWNKMKNISLTQSSRFSKFNLNTDSYVSIPKSQIPEGSNIYINYRTVNNRDQVSATRATGPIVNDSSIPLSPSLDVTYKPANNSLHIELDDLEDPESGIKSVRYAVYYDKRPLPLKSWSDMHTHQGIKNGSFSLSKFIYFSDRQVPDYTKLKVKIMITNGADMQRSITRILTVSDLYQLKNYIPPKQTYPRIGF